ncbi:hypothetical protein P3X46_002971 [Hevea brasiliensis]|uniref:RNase H type-1 domain-containing protein n=1 Tax=Hevea brasiliensis TaxID=3981 RepID=A0ABQ9N5H8_HEVBR|nr:hypothetical protein P3X46_002971 [Hevea brasiliensis]
MLKLVLFSVLHGGIFYGVVQQLATTFNLRWSSPPQNFIKLNCGARVVVPGWIQLGVVFRDHSGEVLVSAIKRVYGPWSTAVSEARAILFGLQLAVDLSFQRVIVESDCLHVIQLIRSADCPNNDLGFVLQDCLDLMHLLDDCSWSFVRWSVNSVAHALAKLHLEDKCGLRKCLQT